MSQAVSGPPDVSQVTRETTWGAREFAEIDLGDRRLDRRLIKICTDFGAHPQASIPQACGDWAATMIRRSGSSKRP